MCRSTKLWKNWVFLGNSKCHSNTRDAGGKQHQMPESKSSVSLTSAADFGNASTSFSFLLGKIWLKNSTYFIGICKNAMTMETDNSWNSPYAIQRYGMNTYVPRSRVFSVCSSEGWVRVRTAQVRSCLLAGVNKSPRIRECHSWKPQMPLTYRNNRLSRGSLGLGSDSCTAGRGGYPFMGPAGPEAGQVGVSTGWSGGEAMSGTTLPALPPTILPFQGVSLCFLFCQTVASNSTMKLSEMQITVVSF